jgi:hypothetical protein
MEEKKLVCPVKRIEKSNIDFKVDFQDEMINIKVDVTTKNIIKSFIDFITNKINGGKNNE